MIEFSLNLAQIIYLIFNVKTIMLNFKWIFFVRSKLLELLKPGYDKIYERIKVAYRIGKLFLIKNISFFIIAPIWLSLF